MVNPVRVVAARNHLSLKFALLVVAIFGVALTALLLVQRTQRKSLSDLLASEVRERSGMMARVVELTGQSLRDFTYDYAQWDDMVAFVQNPRRRWATVNIDPSVENFNLAAVWVLRVDGSMVYATDGEISRRTPTVFPLADQALRHVLEDVLRNALASPTRKTFFLRQAESLFELCVAPILPSDDSQGETTPRGWLVAARAWDAAQLRQLSDLIQCELAIAPPDSPVPPPQPNQVSLQHKLFGPDGAPTANLVYTLRSHELEIVSRDQRIQFGLFAVTFLLTSVFAVFFVYRWVVRPLNAISESLQTHDATLIRPLLAQQDELGQVAQLVKTSFEQRMALEEMIEERIRLGRELHDGVIQTVYAAGMNLAGARSGLRRNPEEAERILDDTRAELNTTIRDLREFIYGLEEEAMPQRPFREAAQSILTLMQGVRPISSTLEIDPDLANRLNARQRLHLLQITREAISNSVRHGQSNHILVRFQREEAQAILEITDDGIGLEREPSKDGGRGMINFAARARELGGSLHVDSMKSGGVRIKLAIPMDVPHSG